MSSSTSLLSVDSAKWGAAANALPPMDQLCDFPEKQKKVMHRIFRERALDREVCLLDVWALDTYEKLGQLKELAKDERKELLFRIIDKGLPIAFLGMGKYLIASSSNRSWNASHLTESSFVLGPKKIEEKIESTSIALDGVVTIEKQRVDQHVRSGNSLRKKLGKKEINKINRVVALLHENFAFYSFILSHEQGHDLFFRYTLGDFSGSVHIEKQDVDKNKQELMLFLKMLVEMQARCQAMGGMSFLCSFFSKWSRDFHQNPKINPERIENLMSMLLEEIRTYAEMHVKSIPIVDNAVAGRLTHEEYCAAEGIRIVKRKTPYEFAQMMIMQESELILHYSYMSDIQRIFEERVAGLMFPEQKTLKETLTRLETHLFNIVVDMMRNEKTSIETAPSDSTVTACHQNNMRQLAGQFKGAIYKRMPDQQISFKVLGVLQFFINYGAGHYTTSSQLLKPYRDVVFYLIQEVLPKMKEAENRLLRHLEKQLVQMDLETLVSHKSKLIRELEDVTMKESFELFRIVILLRDIHLFIGAEQNDAYKVLGKSHELPEALIDFVSLKGLKPLIDRIIREKEKLSKLAKAVPAAQVDEAVPAAQVDEAASESSESEEVVTVALPESVSTDPEAPLPSFDIAHGEKVRHVLSRLTALGFTAVSKRGSHVKFKREGGGAQVIIPTSRDILKAGTAASIVDQVNAALGADDRGRLPASGV